jgi:hypothetical protein
MQHCLVARSPLILAAGLVRTSTFLLQKFLTIGDKKPRPPLKLFEANGG